MDLLTLSDTPAEVGKSPFFTTGDAILVNFTAGALVVQGSDTSGGTYTTVATVPATGMIKALNLPRWLKVSTAATVYALSSNG